MRRIQKIPDDAKLQRIAQVLDEDRDGVIDINDAHKVSYRSKLNTKG
jgi:Ca2+-binding EF-hand superfamily protein